MARLPLPCLGLVTDRRQCGRRALEDVVVSAVAGGVNLVQIREKDLPASQLLALARRLRELINGRALLFVNDRVDVAVACGADGVQLGEEGLPVEAARRVAGRRLLVGRSVHSVEGAVTAEAQGADLLVVGAIFPSRSHAEPVPAGLGLLQQVSRRVRIPFLAIGGVTAENVPSVLEAGASGAAVISAIARSEDPRAASTKLAERMREAWASISTTGATRRR